MTKLKGTLVEEYEISPRTMMVEPIDYGSKIYSRIVEYYDEYISPFPPKIIVQKSCEYFGVGFEGRITGSKKILGSLNKIPITIDPANSIYFFPTSSPQNPKCIWISHEHVDSHIRIDSKTTRIIFRNKAAYEVPISYSSFENQLLRTALLRMRLTKRIEETKKNLSYMSTKHHLKIAEEIDEDNL